MAKPTKRTREYQDLLGKHREFVVFDLETTGLSTKNGDRIIEIGAVRILDDEVVDDYSELINPHRPLPREIVNITHINDSMLRGQPGFERILPQFCDFIDDLPLVAHNASFDIRFLSHYAQAVDRPLRNSHIDTIPLLKDLYPNLTNYKLDTIHQLFGFDDFEHHRALADAQVTAKIFIKIQESYGVLGVGAAPQRATRGVLSPERISILREKYLKDFDLD